MFFPCCVWAHHAPLVLSDWVPSTDGPLLVQQAVRLWVLVGLSVIPADLGQAASVIPVKRLFQSGEKKKKTKTLPCWKVIIRYQLMEVILGL